jgi:hypothetical protein
MENSLNCLKSMNRFVRFNKNMENYQKNKDIKKIRILILTIRTKILKKKNTTSLVEWSLILLNNKRR